MAQQSSSDKRPALDLSPDRPIVSRDADIFGRMPFAEYIAAAIRGWTGNDSLVLALCGEWGTGKSSLKNLVVEELRSKPQESPYIVEFDPWQWAGQEQVAQAFFREIGSELGREDSGAEAKASAKRWQKYGAFLGLGAEVFAGTRRLALVGLAVIAAVSAVGVVDAFFDILAVKIAFGIVAALSLLMFALLKTSNRISKAVADYFSRVEETEQKSLSEIKAELSSSLRTLTRPMLVVVDDVDRLSGPEMMLLFQLIKANANFPNMVYLTLFQREVVEEVISNELSTNGRDYLKKIVQVAFDVPDFQRSKLERALTTKLDNLLDNEAILKLWDQERWAKTFIPGLGPYFKTLREVHRFISTLSLQFAVFSRKDAFEVNPIDLISLEVLRVFEPELFKTLPANKEALTGSSRSMGVITDKNAAEAIVQKASEQSRDNVRAILKSVFPPAFGTSGASQYEGYSDGWFREHRACHPDLFDKYFQMTIPEGDISVEELEKLVSAAADRIALVGELRALGQRQLLDVAIDRLESYKETVSLDHALTFVTALLDVGDELPIGQRGLLEIPTEMHATRIIYFYLKREPSLARRAEVLTQCINETTGIYLPAYVVAIEGDKVKEGRDEKSRLVDEVGLKRLQEACSTKIHQAAEQGTLQKHSRLAQLLSLWQAWSSSEQPREWVQALIDSPDGLLLFLAACLQETRSQSLGAYTLRSIWRIDLQFVEKFVSAEVVESKLAGLPPKDLQEKELEAVKAFHKAMNRKRAGKQGFARFDEE
jgi:predicted KAP-like P-loop ATPase